MHNYVLEDWNTIRGVANATVTQGESGWLDLAPYQDVILWVAVSEYASGAAATLNFQTSPNKEDGLFLTMTQLTVSSVTNPYTVLLSKNPNIPLARYVRWQLVGPSAAWDVTFRVLASCNALGL